jgi:hypothetical protein
VKENCPLCDTAIVVNLDIQKDDSQNSAPPQAPLGQPGIPPSIHR